MHSKLLLVLRHILINRDFNVTMRRKKKLKATVFTVTKPTIFDQLDPIRVVTAEIEKEQQECQREEDKKRSIKTRLMTMRKKRKRSKKGVTFMESFKRSFTIKKLDRDELEEVLGGQSNLAKQSNLEASNANSLGTLGSNVTEGDRGGGSSSATTAVMGGGEEDADAMQRVAEGGGNRKVEDEIAHNGDGGNIVFEMREGKLVVPPEAMLNAHRYERYFLLKQVYKKLD